MSSPPPRWADADLALGSWLLETSPAQHGALARAGFDFLILDCQHSLVDDAAAAAFLTRLRPEGPALIVRASSLDDAALGRLADAGADGIIAPGVETAADAARLVAALRYPPVGRRSYGPLRADLGTESTVIAGRVAAIPLLESAAAIEACAEIAAVDGVDALFVGPADLAISLGVPLAEAFDSPALRDAVRRVVDAASAHGVPVGVHAPDVEAARRWHDLGVAAVAIGSATRLLERAARDTVAALRGNGETRPARGIY